MKSAQCIFCNIISETQQACLVSGGSILNLVLFRTKDFEKSFGLVLNDFLSLHVATDISRLDLGHINHYDAEQRCFVSFVLRKTTMSHKDSSKICNAIMCTS